jgi:mRNA-degrading endonuclease HigB of HigAB toxin-antitoxin module
MAPGASRRNFDQFDKISPSGQNADIGKVTMNKSGHAIIVWTESDGSAERIFKSEYRNGVWTNPSNLSDTISPGVWPINHLRTAMDNNGNALIVWYQLDGTNYQIYKSEYRNGIWIRPTSLEDHISIGGQNAYNPQVAMDDNGNALIVWSQFDGHNFQIFKSEYRNGVWTNPSNFSDKVSDDSQNNEQYTVSPQVAMDNNGNALLIWELSDRNFTQFLKKEYQNGAWTNQSILNNTISANSQSFFLAPPQLAMDSNGNAIIIWLRPDGSNNNQVFKSEYRNGVWTNPSDLDDHINPPGSCADLPQLAMDNNGNAIIVWQQYDANDDIKIYRSVFRNGAWTNPSSLSDNFSSDGQNVYLPQVAMDNNGNAIITWFQYERVTPVMKLFKCEYRDGSWTSPSSIRDGNVMHFNKYIIPVVAMSDNGNALIAFQQSDGNNTQIYKSEYGLW